jgi:hypothetical protein
LLSCPSFFWSRACLGKIAVQKRRALVLFLTHLSSSTHSSGGRPLSCNAATASEAVAP